MDGMLPNMVAIRIKPLFMWSDEYVVSEPITSRIAPPEGYVEEYLTQNFLTDDVGYVLKFDGSRFLESANRRHAKPQGLPEVLAERRRTQENPYHFLSREILFRLGLRTAPFPS
jgi:hypothetical protein